MGNEESGDAAEEVRGLNLHEREKRKAGAGDAGALPAPAELYERTVFSILQSIKLMK